MTEANPPESKSNFFRWFTAAIILLMIVLMVFSSQTMNQQSQAQHGLLLGTSNAGDVQSQDSMYAANLIEQLQSVYIVVPSSNAGLPPRLEPLLSATWGETLVRDLKANPVALYLALRESRRVSPGVNPYALGPLEPEKQSPEQLGVFNSGSVEMDVLRPLPTSPLGQMRLRLGQSYPVELRIVQRTNDGRMPELAPNSLPPLDQSRYYAALSDFFTIQAAASLPLNAVKPSVPMIDRMVAQQFQTFSLQLAAIDARPLLPQVPEPTDEQLRAHLAAYADQARGRLNARNPFGFGYRVADRVKLELISFRRADVRKVVEASKTAYEWEVAARIAYAKDPAAFAAPTTQPDATTVPATRPAAEPFEAVKDRVVAATIDRATDQRAAEMEKAIRSPMTVDYQMWANATGGRGATTAPTATTGVAPKSSVDVAYDSPEYLRRIAAAVQAKFKVLPTVEQYTDRFRDLNALSLLGGFNDATRELPIDFVRRTGRTSEVVTGPQYAIDFSRDLLDPAEVEVRGALVLERYRPSERIESRRGDNGSEREVFVFRVTEAEQSHPAKDLEPIREQVKSDWRQVEVQKLALEQARSAVTAIQGGTEFAAAVSAAAPGTQTIRTDVGPFRSPPPEGSPLQLSMPAYAQFGLQLTDKLLGKDVTVAALDVPLAGKAYVTQRLAMSGVWANEEELRALRQGLRSQYAIQMTFPKSDSNPFGLASDDLAAAWLTPKNVFERFAYKPSQDEDAK